MTLPKDQCAIDVAIEQINQLVSSNDRSIDLSVIVAKFVSYSFSFYWQVISLLMLHLCADYYLMLLQRRAIKGVSSVLTTLLIGNSPETFPNNLKGTISDDQWHKVTSILQKEGIANLATLAIVIELENTKKQ